MLIIAHILLSVQRNPPVAIRPVVLFNRNVRLTVHPDSGTYDLAWQGHAELTGLAAEVKLADGAVVRTTACTQHAVQIIHLNDRFGKGIEAVMTHKWRDRIQLRESFWIYDDRPEVLTRIDAASAKGVSTNYMAPVISTRPLFLAHNAPLQALFVPYDNDDYFRYRSDAWSVGKADQGGSYEVTALYDDSSRNGLVVGSIDHDTWKSAVRFQRSSKTKEVSLLAFAGASSKYTHDTQPHGHVTGREVHSPRMVLGYYSDWRDGLEHFADLNAISRPPLHWDGAIPFGWNSWSGHKTKLKAEHAQAAIDFFVKDIPAFRSGDTAYINLDSFWDNLTLAQRAEFVSRAHAAGLKAGIYYTPFVGWNKLTAKVDHTKFTYRDLTLKDAKGNPVPQIDGGWPLDPTNPASIARMDRQFDQFIKLGFDYVKLDFMTHGSLEGQHFDKRIQTGTQAYNFGMRHIVDYLSPSRVGRPFFISLSIAPMFPAGYAHSRRISCDAFANIGATEYLLNSATYGWWTNNRIYQFNDPDSTCVYQPLGEPVVSEAEARSRFTASVLVGGMLIESDDLTNPAAKRRVRSMFTNSDILTLAKRHQAFRPVNGGTGSKAGEAFVLVDEGGKSAYVAIFNYSKTEKTFKSIPMSRFGLTAGPDWLCHEMWTGVDAPVGDNLAVNLDPMSCVLLHLTQSKGANALNLPVRDNPFRR